MVVVVDGSVSGGTTVVNVVVDELVDVLLDVVGPAIVVVGAGAFVTLKPVVASSVELKAWMVALPAMAEGGTITGPENDDEPFESAVPIRVGGFPGCRKSMMMQLTVPDGHAW